MNDIITATTGTLRALIERAAAALMQSGALPEAQLPQFLVEIPADRQNGDFTSNFAMAAARALHKSPRDIANLIAGAIDLSGSPFERCAVAGPGFINFYLSQDFYADAVRGVLGAGADYGRSDYGKGQKAMVEFVSANPTGPMHMGNARGGAIGDVLASVLDFAGYRVTREFYVNDAGNQIDKFGRSLEARYMQLCNGEDAFPFPEDGYHGADIRERAAAYRELHGDALCDAPEEARRAALIAYALPLNIEKLKSDLELYRIRFDVWFRESTLHESGAVAQVIEKLRERGETYEQDGALWYRATAHGAEKDEVLVRSGGFPTYFASDIAYHYNKFVERGFDWVIDIWGADHHGHVARMHGVLDAIGIDSRQHKLDILLMQMVRLTSGGEVVRMSKRTGNAITLSSLIEEIPIDAARFFFNMRDPGSQMEFDLDLAVQQNSQNPVYYVQYAHARICSILRAVKEEGGESLSDAGDLQLLTAPEERELIRSLALLPAVIADAARAMNPAAMTKYLSDTATLFHKFYNSCRVRGEAPPLQNARLALCRATQIALRNVLSMIQIDAPETM